jgi:23S rRNA (adenine2503-C2)-methyltransferase
MMRIVGSAGHPEIAMVYVVEFPGGLVECVEAVQPPTTRDEKWVMMISTLFGCPVSCQMCDAGGHYRGKLTQEEMFAQVEFLIRQRFPDGHVPSSQLKIQFARMGEPALNPAVLDLLQELPLRIDAPGLFPSLSTVAPLGTDSFFDKLIEIKDDIYPRGRFQLQFSIHTTDQTLRDQLVPVKKWDFLSIARFGHKYFSPGDRKITLNFALAEASPIDPGILLEHFSPERFLIKITPLNPTHQAISRGLKSYVDPGKKLDAYPELIAIQEAGYDVILSIGEQEESRIGSNCGQYVQKHLLEQEKIRDGYTYQVDQVEPDAEKFLDR